MNKIKEDAFYIFMENVWEYIPDLEIGPDDTFTYGITIFEKWEKKLLLKEYSPEKAAKIIRRAWKRYKNIITK